jgi:hypothetical protein
VSIDRRVWIVAVHKPLEQYEIINGSGRQPTDNRDEQQRLQWNKLERSPKRRWSLEQLLPSDINDEFLISDQGSLFDHFSFTE